MLWRNILSNGIKIPFNATVVSPGTFTRSISTPLDSVLSIITISSVVSESIVTLVISGSDVAEAFTIIGKDVLVTSVVIISDVLAALESEAFVIGKKDEEDAVVAEGERLKKISKNLLMSDFC